MQWLTENWQYLTLAVTGASVLLKAVAKMTPNKRDDGWAAKFEQLLGWLSLNTPGAGKRK